MTINDTFHVFFNPVHKHCGRAKYAKSFAEVHNILHPSNIVQAMAQGADDLESKLGIQSNHRSRQALEYTIERANTYAQNHIEPKWNDLKELLDADKYGGAIGQGLEWAGVLPEFGKLIGRMIGMNLFGGLRRGDILAGEVAERIDILINSAKNDFKTQVMPTIQNEFRQ